MPLASGILYISRNPASQDRGPVLLLKRALTEENFGGYWSLPGGKIDAGEDPATAAARESKEEIGYEPAVDDLEEVSANDKFVTFRCYVDGEFTPFLNPEHIDYRWCARDDLPRPVHPGVKKVLTEMELQTALDAEFKEGDHPRAENGQFGSGGGEGGGEGEAVKEKSTVTKEHFDAVSAAATYRAIKLGYSPAKIKVSADPPATYKLGDVEFKPGAEAYTGEGHPEHPKGTIVVYAGFTSPEHVHGLMAHEVMHQKFETVLDKARDEKKDIMKEMDRLTAEGKDPRRDGPLKASGGVRDSYAGRWPVYEKIDPILSGKASKLAKEDGVTKYSRMWWDAHSKGHANTKQAIHETLAEMANNHHVTGGEKRLLNPGLKSMSSTGGSKTWRDLFAAVNSLYEKHK